MLNEIAQSIAPAIVTDPARLNAYLRQHDTSRSIFSTGVYREGTVVAEYPFFEGRIGTSLKDCPVFTIAAPLRDASGHPAGTLAGSLYPSDPNLFGKLEETKLGKSGYFLGISPKTKVIVSATDQNRIMQLLPPKGVIRCSTHGLNWR